MTRNSFTARLGLFFGLIFSVSLGLNLGACTTTNGGSPAGALAKPATQQSPAQIAAQVCPPLQVAIAGLQADIGLPQGALHELALAAPQVQSLCASAMLATTNDATTLENLAFGVVLPIAQAQNPRLAADLLAVQIVLSVVQAAQASQSVTVPAAVSPPAK